MYRAIVIDDDPIMREMLASFTRWADVGVTVESACEDGRSAWARIKALKPDIVITDIRLPGLSGMELLQRIREHKFRCEVIIVSVSSEFPDAQLAVRLGAFDYLLKPVAADMLKACLYDCVQKIEEDRSAAKESLVIDSDEFSQYTRRTLRFIQEHYREQICLDAVAQSLNISGSHLSKVFKEDTGSTFYEYLIRFRMQNARRLIEEGAYKVYEVAAMVGYADAVHFSKMFKKTFGISPKRCVV